MLKLYNTMSRSLEEFRPRRRGEAVVFTCGPSIYRRPHIGNYRTFLYEDVLIRYLEYLGYRVDHAMPLTDIEDKTIMEAVRRNKKIEELTGDIETIFRRESRLLNIRLPRKLQRVSRCVDTAASIIRSLIEKGYAYRHGPDIFFDPLKDEDFGRLYRLDMRRWPKKKVRFRRDTYPGNRWNLGDFILWHGYREGDISWWETPIGKGRPSWNVQDPSVIVKHLGNQVDINCGGIDNIYRHHDYNIAIMESFTGMEYAKYFLHGEHLIVDGRPMSKSRGNIRYLEDVINSGCSPKDLRYFLLATHYRKKLNFTEKAFEESCRKAGTLRRLVSALLRTRGSGKKREDRIGATISRIRTVFEEHMNNDLSFGDAFDAVFSVLRDLDGLRKTLTAQDIRSLHDELKRIDAVMAVIF